MVLAAHVAHIPAIYADKAQVWNLEFKIIIESSSMSQCFVGLGWASGSAECVVATIRNKTWRTAFSLSNAKLTFLWQIWCSKAAEMQQQMKNKFATQQSVILSYLSYLSSRVHVCDSGLGYGFSCPNLPQKNSKNISNKDMNLRRRWRERKDMNLGI